jgi:MFS transporter, DHA2 family, multidrug resistance protein
MPQEAHSVVEYGLRRGIVTIAVIAATVLEIIDTTIVNVALPDIQGNFGTPIDQSAWIVTGYIIANVIVIPITPWLAQRFGRRQYFFASIVIFTIASLMCGLAGTFGSLVFWRIVQGMGGGGLLSTSQAILRDTYPISEQGKAQGFFAMGVIVGPALGPVLGGWLTYAYSWRWVFFVNLPIGIAAAALIWSFLRNPEEPQRKELDWIGLAMLVLGLGSMQYVLEQGQRYDWFDDGNIRLLSFLSIASLAGFAWWTLRSKIPLVDLHVLRLRQAAAGSVLGAVLGVSLYASVVILPQYLQGSLHFTPVLAGMTILIRALAVMAFTPVTAAIVQRGLIDVRINVAIGFVLLGISNWTLAAVTAPDAQVGTFVGALVLSGMGLSQIFVPLSVAVLGGVPERDVPATAAFFNLSRQIGGSIATAVLITMVVRGITTHQMELFDSQTLSRPGVATYVQQHGGEHNNGALVYLQGLATDQATVLSYADTSRATAIITFAFAPLVLLLRKPRTGFPMAAE